MSAFLCSARHLSAIVNAATLLEPYARPTIVHHLSPATVAGMYATQQTDAEALFNELFDENMRSVAYRYPDATRLSDWQTDEAPPMTYSPRVRPPSVVVALKLIQCYRYQSCEHEGWETSQAKAYTDQLFSALVGALPGYDDAPWAMD